MKSIQQAWYPSLLFVFYYFLVAMKKRNMSKWNK